MPPERRSNWIHLDLKGTMPGEAMLLRWIDWLADAGFDGIVWEYEDRLPWQAWPGTHRPVLSMAQWQSVWDRCRDRNMVSAPLVQVQGHLEWLLKRDEYAAMREDGHVSEICPQHPETLPRLTAWLDEVIELHPDSPVVHLGADETWHLGSCPRCRAKAQSSRHGKLSIYLDHVGALCEHVKSRGKTPMIWADMFWREADFAAAAGVPDGVVLVDWHYGGAGPWPSTRELKRTGRHIWGASAIRSGYEQKNAIAPLEHRIDNVLGWHAVAQQGEVAGLLHTVWGRTNSVRPIYGPWEGWLAAFLAAGDPEHWSGHVLEPLVAEVDAAMYSPEWIEHDALIDRLSTMTSEDAMVEACLRWWALALRHRRLFWTAIEGSVHYLGMEAVQQHTGVDPGHLRTMRRQREQLLRDLDAWEADARQWWQQRALSDADEYFATKVNNLRRLLEPEWAASEAAALR